MEERTGKINLRERSLGRIVGPILSEAVPPEADVKTPIWGDPEVESTGKMAVDRGLIQPRVEECQRRN